MRPRPAESTSGCDARDEPRSATDFQIHAEQSRKGRESEKRLIVQQHDPLGASSSSSSHHMLTLELELQKRP